MDQGECKALDGLAAKQLDGFFKKKYCFVEVNPGEVVMPRKFSDIRNDVLDTVVNKNDVWVVSFPRTGKLYGSSF